MTLQVLTAGPSLSLQDVGRPGYLSFGISRGGAMDPWALVEAAALLTQKKPSAAIEMAGLGGTFRAERDLRIALTGAPMRATIDGQSVMWGASHLLEAGKLLEIGAATAGVYGYLSVGGGFDVDPLMGAQAADLKAGILGRISAGDVLSVGPDHGGTVGMGLAPDDRFSGGAVRVLPTAQTEDFPEPVRARLSEATFTRDPRSNRQAVRLGHAGEGFAHPGGLAVLSEITQPGDIQVTGDGTPVVLMAEGQTTGGYPRIATVLPADLARVAQLPVGSSLRMRWITLDEGLAAERDAAGVRPRPYPLVRDPKDMANLLTYSLIDGFVTGAEEIS